MKGPVVRLLARCQPDGKEGGCDLLPDAVVTAGAQSEFDASDYKGHR